jgi:hypothetical protein
MTVGACCVQDLQELVSLCLKKEPAERWTARRLMKHRFWKVGWNQWAILMTVAPHSL